MVFEMREWRMEDAGTIAKYANNCHVADNLRNVFPYPYTLEDAKKYIYNCIEADPAGQLVRAISVNGQAVGSIGIYRMDDVYCKSAEIGYWLGEPFWGRGIMSAAVKEMCRLAFAEYDIVRIFAETFAGNIGSRRALENAGFQLEGVLRKSIYKNGCIMDSCIYGLTR